MCFTLQLTEKTRQALDKLVSQKIAAAMPVRAADKQAPAQYIRCALEPVSTHFNLFVTNGAHCQCCFVAVLSQRYTPSQQGVAFNSGAKQRVIRMVEMQKDPMEPPRFK